ncbi:MAG: PTS glucitol/sorbitol transporter subunit IIA [Absicoccus sp.]|uniref:PTS glucitol/sorbitol transporter subunit IIA n=1 Tax=Absicoccus intestinalis TaxID=2926319 RepID=A0ABU4WIW2_9FIRM|nr:MULTISPECIES: PTS glucitol/sorbitol transporter subunit IIA [unclassified Absicoccus]MDX8416490.1 PTS glucitol/sorbitol transporter subunit IIA [Absicoccus sp. CLA-KB-P134]MDY3036348.1 PTS glucitol/sorbitol transporter subunit IIA [Absicoccus sp.]
MKTCFSTHVMAVGPQVSSFQKGDFIILFGTDVPDELKAYSYIIEKQKVDAIQPGQILRMDGIAYPITAVGSEVMDTLQTMGHCTIRFNGAKEPQMPGTIYVEKKDVPTLHVGSSIEIVEVDA